MDDDASARIRSAMVRATDLSEKHFSLWVRFENEPEHEGFANAREIRAQHCLRLVELPAEIGMLHRLVELNLRCCVNLQRLPPEIGRLTKLEVLNLSCCSRLTELPDEIGRLTSLKELSLSCCDKLERLPRSLHRLFRLEVLNLSECGSLVGLPSDIFRLRSLKRFLSCCRSLTRLPPGIGQLHQLEDLDLCHCNGLTEIPVEIGQLLKLKTLSLYGLLHCTLQEFFQNIGTSSFLNLTNLDLCGCRGLEELPPALGSLRNLEGLSLKGCKQLTQVSKEVLVLPCLKSLSLWRCFALTVSPKEIGEASYSVESVQMPTNESQGEMDCYCEMNKAGRHLLRRESGVPVALWPHVLAGRRSDENFIFWFLKHNPNFVKKRVKIRGTKRACEE